MYLRRAIAKTLMLGLAACTSSPTMTVVTPATAPPATKIGRLLVWLPPSQLMSFEVVRQAFKAKLAAHGVAAEVGMSQPLELDRTDAQREIVRSLNPTHRLEFDAAGSVTLGNYGTSSGFASAKLLGRLYQMGEKAPLRTLVFSVRGAATPKLIGESLADSVVEKLQEEGFL